MFLGELISQISMALAMFAAGALLVPLARRLNEYENHKTDTEFENHLISKVFVLQFATAYGPLFYIAAGRRERRPPPRSFARISSKCRRTVLERTIATRRPTERLRTAQATVMDYMPAWTGKRRWGCRGSEPGREPNVLQDASG